MKKRFHKVYLEITNVCNLKCSFCHGTSRKPGFLSCSDFALLAKKLRPYTDYLYLHLMGEPLLHPELGDILDHAARLGFQVCITTNGTLLPKVLPLLEAHSQVLYKISISLHSAEAADTDLIPYVSSCLDAAARLAEKEVISVLRLWNLGEGGKNDRNGDILAMLHQKFTDNWVKVRSGSRLSDRVYLEWGEKFDWPDPSAPENGENIYCYGLIDQLGVLCDGSVVPCCLDSDGNLTLGNLFTEELETILSSPRALAILEGFRNRKAPEELCRRCGYARRF